ncbi:hypothetical protein BFG07_08500 [Kosakonia cowanii]|nr:hypothetical protein BFG07_08500 [Kosakonia cowanii]
MTLMTRFYSAQVSSRCMFPLRYSPSGLMGIPLSLEYLSNQLRTQLDIAVKRLTALRLMNIIKIEIRKCCFAPETRELLMIGLLSSTMTLSILTKLYPVVVEQCSHRVCSTNGYQAVIMSNYYEIRRSVLRMLVSLTRGDLLI